MKILVTGTAGFIGFHTATALLGRGDDIVGFDAVNDYYDVALKEARLELLEATARSSGASYTAIRANLADRRLVDACFAAHRFDRVIHLAAQAGVRYSIENPHAYIESNVVGFVNILEACRHQKVPHLTYASSSSVYGGNTKVPYSEQDGVNHPLSLYAATKRSNELMAHTYSHLYGLPTTGLRFFTVYGPWGRPDMSPILFAKCIEEGRPIKVFNHGNHSRDFTYIDDIVEGVIRTSDRIAAPDPKWRSDHPDPSTSSAPFKVYNIGNNAPVNLGTFIAALEKAFGKTAQREMLPMQPGDVPDTYADVSKLVAAVGYRPSTSIGDGVDRFVAWYRSYYGKK